MPNQLFKSFQNLTLCETNFMEQRLFQCGWTSNCLKEFDKIVFISMIILSTGRKKRSWTYFLAKMGLKVKSVSFILLKTTDQPVIMLQSTPYMSTLNHVRVSYHHCEVKVSWWTITAVMFYLGRGLEIQESDPEEPPATAWHCGIIQLRHPMRSLSATCLFKDDHILAKRVFEMLWLTLFVIKGAWNSWILY